MTTITVLTNAPSAYDYDYTVEVAAGLTIEQYVGQRNPPSNVRRVTIPDAHFDYQTARYHSGLYFTINETEATK